MEGYVRVGTDGIFWYMNKRLHRTDGPAAVWARGARTWYIAGKYLTEEAFSKRKKEWKAT